MPLLHTIYIRFFGELKDFLPPSRKGRRFDYIIKGCPSVKDTLEAIGVPHVAVDSIFINQQACDFSYQLKEGDEIKVYPAGYNLKGRNILRLNPAPVRVHFIADSHLGKLARHLRLLGFNVLYQTVFPDKLIVRLAVRQRRIILTRDKGLLKHRCLRWGYWVRSFDPDRQVREVIKQYGLLRHLCPFCRCVECNGLIKAVAKARVLARLPPKTRMYYRRFYRCQKCRRIYWKGSHYRRMMLFIGRLRKKR